MQHPRALHAAFTRTVDSCSIADHLSPIPSAVPLLLLLLLLLLLPADEQAASV
jgi:hypothetical protein